MCRCYLCGSPISKRPCSPNKHGDGSFEEWVCSNSSCARSNGMSLFGRVVVDAHPEFASFPKIPRLSRECVITEKIDGTNAQIYIGEDGSFAVGSRSRWITPENDNHGFARWAYANKDDLLTLGPGRHFGEWWGQGIQRGYGLKEKRFSLFNTALWSDDSKRPSCCHVVPILYKGLFTSEDVDACMEMLRMNGSFAAPHFDKPEGVIVFHSALNGYFKRTLENDYGSKSNQCR